jgi:hypothetical protein
VHAYVAEAFAAGRTADFHREAAAARMAATIRQGPRPTRSTRLAPRLVAWAERLRARRSVGVCCPA